MAVASNTLITRVRTVGAALAAREIRNMGDAVGDAGREAHKAHRPFRDFFSAFSRFSIRGVPATHVFLAAASAAAVFSPAITAASAAMVTLGGMGVPAMMLAVAAHQRYADTANIAGSGANRLKGALNGMKHAFNQVTSPGASIVMRGLADALDTLRPAFLQLEGPMTVFAQSLADTIRTAAPRLAALIPKIGQIITNTAPLIPMFGELASTWAEIMVDIAGRGIGPLNKITQWAIGFSHWLSPAIDNFSNFLHGDLFRAWLQDIGTAFRTSFQIIGNLLGIFVQLATNGRNFAFTIKLALDGLKGINDLLGWVNKNIGSVDAITTPLIGLFIAWRTKILLARAATQGLAAAAWAYNAAMAALAAGSALMTVIALTREVKSLRDAWILLTLAMETNVFVLVLTAVVALALGIYELYKHSETFRNILGSIWQGLQDFVAICQTAVDAVRGGLGAAFDFIADKARAVWGFIEPILKAIDKITRFTPGGALLHFGVGLVKHLTGHKAYGGQINDPGNYIVGERGPEIVHLPSGATVYPNGTSPTGGGPVVVVSNLYLESRPVAQAVQRVQTRKASVS